MSSNYTENKQIQEELLAAYHKEANLPDQHESPEVAEDAFTPFTRAQDEASSMDESQESIHSQEFQNKISNGIETAKNSIATALENAERALVYQFEQWKEMQRIIDQERRVISEVYGVSVPGDSLAAIVQLRLERRAKAEHALAESKQEFNDEMDKRRLELQMRQEAFDERCRQWEADFVSKCQHWEDEMAHRQETFIELEKELGSRKKEQEEKWISRSEELDRAYQQRIHDLEVAAQEKESTVTQTFAERQRKMEEEWSFRQSKWEEEIQEYQEQLQILQDQLRDKTEEISRVNTRVLDLVSRKDITERLGSINHPRSTSMGSKIVRPLKVQSKRTDV